MKKTRKEKQKKSLTVPPNTKDIALLITTCSQQPLVVIDVILM